MSEGTDAHTPGYKSTEFWLSFAAVLAGFILASGAVVEGSTAATIVGGVLTVLGALGYTSSRTSVKVAEEARKREEAKGASFVAYAAEKVKTYLAERDRANAELETARLTSSPTPGPNTTPAVGDAAQPGE